MTRHSRSNIQDMFSTLKAGNEQLLQEYVRGGGNIDMRDEDDKTLLIHSIFEGDVKRARELISLGCNVNLATKSGLSPLHIGCQIRNSQIVQLLLKNGADIKSKTDIGRTPLMQAIIVGSLDIVDKLLASGSDVNVFDHTGNTPLQIALLMDREDIAEKLVVQKGINLSLSFRCRMDEHFIPITEYLLRHGANPFVEVKGGHHRKAFFQAMFDLEMLSSQVISSSFEQVYNDIYTEYGLSTASYERNKILQEIFNCRPISRLFDIELTLQVNVQRTVNKMLTKFLTILKNLSKLGLIFPTNTELWTCDHDNERLVDILNQLKVNHQFLDKLKELQTSPPSLKQQCRTVIRSQLEFGVSKKVNELPLPDQIKKYLCFPELK